MSRAIAFLMKKRFWRFRFIHVVIAVLVAAVMVSIVLFQGYLLALSGEFSGQLTYPTIPAAFLVRREAGQSLPSVSRTAPQLSLSIWSVVAPGGRVELAGVASVSSTSWPLPQPGEVWLPSSQRGLLYDQQAGGQLALTRFNGRDWSTTTARVAGYYDDGGYLSPILANLQWASDWLHQTADSTVVGYPEGASQELQRWANSNTGVELLTAQSIAQSASNLVTSLYSGGSSAVLLGAVFLGLGFGVMALLVFLDSRTELAILKAMGTRPHEAGLFFWLEFGCSGLVGILLGWGVSHWLELRLGSLIALDWSVFRTALYVVVGAYALAMLAPARLARRAQVNELLLHRPILLWSQSVSALSRREISLDDLTSRGWSCIKLDQDGDRFPGIVLRPVGSAVKEGETLAWQSTCFGLGEKKYQAPHDGVLVVADEQRGVLAISPANSGL